MAQTVQQPIAAHQLDELILQDTKSCPAIKYPGRQHAQFAYLIEKRFKIRPPELRARMKRLGLWHPDPAPLHQKHHHPHPMGPGSSRPNGTKLHLNISGINTSNKPEPMEPRSPLTPVASPIHQFSNSLMTSNPHSPVTPVCTGPGPMSMSSGTSSSMMTPPSSSDGRQREDDLRPTLPKLILSSESGGNTKIDICTSPAVSSPPSLSTRPSMHHGSMMQHNPHSSFNPQSRHDCGSIPTLRPIAQPQPGQLQQQQQQQQQPQQPQQRYPPSNIHHLRQLRRIDTQTPPPPGAVLGPVPQQPKRARVKVTSAALKARLFPIAQLRGQPLVVFKIRGGSEGGKKLRDARRMAESRRLAPPPPQPQGQAPPSLVIGREQLLRSVRGL